METASCLCSRSNTGWHSGLWRREGGAGSYSRPLLTPLLPPPQWRDSCFIYQWDASKDFPDKENCRETCIKTESDNMVCTQGVQVVLPYDPECKNNCGAHPPDSTYDLRFDVHDCNSTGGPGLNLGGPGPDGLDPLIGNVERAGGFVEWPYAGGPGTTGPLIAKPYPPTDAMPLPVCGLMFTYMFGFCVATSLLE